MARVERDPESRFLREVATGGRVILIGLDPGESFGFAALQIEGKQRFELRESTSWRLDKGMRFRSRGSMLIRLGEYLQPYLDAWREEGPLLVVYETARFFKTVCQAQSSAAFGAHAQFLCEVAKIPFINLEPSEVKRWATGKGNAPKDLVRRSMIGVFGAKQLKKGNRTEDEFDAIAVAYAQARKAGWIG